ncbi:unnamed protein product, partial [marine sediment metagenome]
PSANVVYAGDVIGNCPLPTSIRRDMKFEEKR